MLHKKSVINMDLEEDTEEIEMPSLAPEITRDEVQINLDT